MLPRLEDLLPLLPGGATAAVLLVLAGLLQRREEMGPQWLTGILAGIACGLAPAVTWWMTHDGLPWPPNASTERMIWAMPAVGLLGALCAEWPRAGRAAVLAVAFFGLVWWLLNVLLATGGESRIGWLAVALASGGALLYWALIDALGDRQEDPVLPIALALAFGAAGQVLVIYGSASLGQLAGTCAIGLGVYGVLGGVLALHALPRAAAAGVCAVAAGVGFDAWFYSIEPLPALPLLAIAGAPLLAVLTRVRALAESRSYFRTPLVLLLVAVPIGWAVWHVFENAPNDPYTGFGK